MADTLVATVVPDEPSLLGARVAVTNSSGHALLRVSGRTGIREIGVACFADRSVPADRIVLSESLASRVGVQGGDTVELFPMVARPVSELMLESLTEEPSKSLWERIREDGQLVGQCFWTGSDPDAVLLDIGDTQFRVRSFDQPSASELRVVTAETSIELFVQGARIGLDMVILADVSGSMGVDDLPSGPSETHGFRLQGSHPGNVKRIDALRAALIQMLDARLRIQGRESRMALLSFATTVDQQFPRSPGMATVDAQSDPRLIQEFRGAIAALEAKGTTAMSEAILRAAELLDRYGKEDNERLIVLVSDGKPFSPKSADATGEVLQLRNDELNLVTYLFKNRGIRLQSIGISDEGLFRAWEARTGTQPESLRPDHGLIQRLANAGGGDPNRTGGVDVLIDVFQGLGAGYRRFVGRPTAGGRLRALSPHAQTALTVAEHELGAGERVSIMQQFDRDALMLNQAFATLCGSRLGVWVPFDIQAAFNTARHVLEDLTVTDERAFADFAKRLHTLMVQQGPARNRGAGRRDGDWPEEVDEWYRPLVELGARINIIRIFNAHDKNLTAKDQKDIDRLNEAMEHFVSCRKIAPSDRNGWGKLAAEMLRETGALVQRCARESSERALQVVPTGPVFAGSVPASIQAEVKDFDQTRRGAWEGRIRD